MKRLERRKRRKSGAFESEKRVMSAWIQLKVGQEESAGRRG